MIIKKVFVDEMLERCEDCPINWLHIDNFTKDCGKEEKGDAWSRQVPDERCLCELENEVE